MRRALEFPDVACPQKLPLILFCAVSLLASQPAAATLVDWDTLGWTPGSLSNSYDIDPNKTGNDVTFTLSDNVNTFTNDATSGVQTPAITMSLAGGVSPVQNSLQLSANLRSSTTITFTANFSAQYYLGVQGVSFSIFDIDLESDRDQINNIFGIATDGSHVAATITVGSAVTRSGTGLTQLLVGAASSPNTGSGSQNGNALIDFGSTPITGFSFDWSNNAGQPFYQEIAVADVLFNAVVPEANAGAVAALFCGAAAALRSHRTVLALLRRPCSVRNGLTISPSKPVQISPVPWGKLVVGGSAGFLRRADQAHELRILIAPEVISADLGNASHHSLGRGGTESFDLRWGIASRNQRCWWSDAQ